jgi:hypothetical protein
MPRDFAMNFDIRHHARGARREHDFRRRGDKERQSMISVPSLPPDFTTPNTRGQCRFAAA